MLKLKQMAEPLVPGRREALITPPAVEASIEDGQRLHDGDVNKDFESFMAVEPVAALAATLIVNKVATLTQAALAEGLVDDDPYEIARFSSKATIAFFARALAKMQARQLEEELPIE